MKTQIYRRIGTYAYPTPPIRTSLGKTAEIHLFEGGDGYVTLGTHAFPIRGGVGLLPLSTLKDGTYAVQFVIQDARLDSDPISVERGEGTLLPPDTSRRGMERIEHAVMLEKAKETEERIRVLEDAVFRTTIF